MPSTYTLNNGIELIGTGEQSGTWGDTTNTNLGLLDTALDGQVTVTLPSAGTSGSPNTLAITDGAASDGRNRMVTFADGGDLGATAYVQLTPNDSEKIIYVRNTLAGSRSIILFQGTYNASNDYEVPAGTTAVVYFDGAGSGAVAANVFNNAHFDALNVVGNVTVGGDVTVTGTVDAGTVEFDNLSGTGAVSVTNILDEDNMASDSATALSTQQSIKAYVDAQVGANNELSEVLANGNTTGGTDIAVSTGDDITFADDSKAIFGDASEFQIYHTAGGVSYITETGVGGLFLQGANVVLENTSGDNYFLGVDGGASTLYYSGASKLATTATGIDVTGTAVMDGLTVDGASDSTPAVTISANNNALGTKNTLRFFDDDGAVDNGQQVGRIEFYTDDNTNTGVNAYFEVTNNTTGYGTMSFATGTSASLAERMSIGGTGDITFYDASGNASFVYDESAGSTFNEQGADRDFRVESDNNANMLFVDAGNDRIGIGTGSPTTAMLHVANAADSASWHDNNTIIYTLDGSITEAQQREMFTITAGSTRTSCHVRITFIPHSTGGIGSMYGGFMDLSIQRADSGVTTNVERIQNVSFGAGSVSMMMPTVSGNVVTFGMHAGNNGTGSTYSVETRIEITSHSPTNWAVADKSVANATASGTSLRGGWFIGGNDGQNTMSYRYGDVAETVINDASENVDFRVESDNNTHAFFVEAGSSRIAMGSTDNSTAHLNVDGDISGGYGGMIRMENTGTDGCMAFIGVTNTNWSIGSEKLIIGRGNQGDNTSSALAEMVISGSEVVFNENSNDRDFRVESDTNSHMLFVDAGNNRVGINNSAPESALSVNGDILSNWNNVGEQKIGINGRGSNTFSTTEKTLIITGADAVSGAQAMQGGDVIVRGGVGAGNAALNIFGGNLYLEGGEHTGGAGVTSGAGKIVLKTAGYNRQEIFSSGAVVFNNDSYDADFRVESDGNSAMLFVDAGDNQVRIATITQLFSTTAPKLEIYDSSGTSGGVGVKLQSGTNTSYAGYNYWGRVNGSGSTHYAFAFYDGPSGTLEGSISVTSSGTSYNTTSDYRLKENVVELIGATERLKQLEPKRFNFIKEGDTPTVDGFLAHEVSSVVPEAVTGTHNEVDADGNPVYQGIDQSKLVPLLTAALQEAITKIETLEARITALENA